MAIALNLLNVVFLLLGGYVAITFLFPFLRDFLSSVLKSEKGTDGLMGVLNIYVIIFVTIGVVEELISSEVVWLNYLQSLNAGLNLLTSLIPYLQYLVLGGLVVLGLNSLRK